MKFLVDENVGKSVTHYLTEKGHDVIVTEKDITGREDFLLLDYAFRENRIVITNDKDFGFLIYRQRLQSRGIILFRFNQELPTFKIAALETIISRKPDQIFNHFIVASEGKIRVRPLVK